MIIVFPVGQRDCMLASRLIRYLRDLRQTPSHRVLIVYDCKAERSWRRQLSIMFGSIFSSIHEIETPRSLENEAWPHGPNWMHRIAARWIQSHHPTEPWFWFEPDCTPLVRSWIQVLEEEHTFNGTEFTGQIQHPGPKDTYWAHVAGCRISPGNFFKKYGFIYENLNRAFDLEAADKIVPATTQTNRMLHQYFIDTDSDILIEKGPPGGYDKIIPKGYVLPTFSSTEDVDRMISGGYVIQHRCKDGSLIEWARKYHGLEA